MNKVICVLVLVPELVFAGMATGATKVSLVNGAIILVSPSGAERKLTAGPSDSDPSLTPDGKHVVFVRNHAGSVLSPDVQPRPQNIHLEILCIGIDGKRQEVLFSGDVHYKQFTYDTFSSPKIAPSGRYLYFLVPLEAVSDGLVRLDLATHDVRMIMPAQTVIVLDAGPYKNFLVVQRRIQGKEGATYPFWLLSPEGRPVRQIGDERAASRFVLNQQGTDQTPM